MEREGKIPPAGEMSAKRTKGGRIKARLVIQSPPANACKAGNLPSAARFFVNIRFHEKYGGLSV